MGEYIGVLDNIRLPPSDHIICINRSIITNISYYLIQNSRQIFIFILLLSSLFSSHSLSLSPLLSFLLFSSLLPLSHSLSLSFPLCVSLSLTHRLSPFISNSISFPLSVFFLSFSLFLSLFYYVSYPLSFFFPVPLINKC